MRIVSVMHDVHVPTGLLSGCVTARGATLDEVMPANGGLPSPEDFDGLIVLGGPMSANDETGHPYFPALLDLIRATHAADLPIMGVCLGAQLIARAFGAVVRPHPHAEIGFTATHPTPAADGDPLLDGEGPTRWIMQWHHDTFDLPEGAVLLMTGARCRNQAFRLGPATYGFQFHLEATPEIVADWIAATRAELARDDAAFPELFARQVARHFAEQEAFTWRVGLRWLDLVEARQAAGTAAR